MRLAVALFVDVGVLHCIGKVWSASVGFFYCFFSLRGKGMTFVVICFRSCFVFFFVLLFFTVLLSYFTATFSWSVMDNKYRSVVDLVHSFVILFLKYRKTWWLYSRQLFLFRVLAIDGISRHFDGWSLLVESAFVWWPLI